MNANEISSAMTGITHGVYVIGTNSSERKNLMTAAWLVQVSGKPPMIAVAVSKGHYTAELIKESEKFSISVLGPEQKDIALKCGSVSGRSSDKLVKVEHVIKGSGLPYVKGAAMYLECMLSKIFEVNDHYLFVGVVTAGEKISDKRLLYNEI